MITYITTSTISGTQTEIYFIDNRREFSDNPNGVLYTNIGDIDRNTIVPATASCTGSNNGYGLSVRPVHD